MRLVKNIKLIVVDTLARSFGGGNENAPQDMGEFINSCDELMHEFGATVLIVHHVGKDAQSGARGHSSFFGALDTSMTIIMTVTSTSRRKLIVTNKIIPKPKPKMVV